MSSVNGHAACVAQQWPDLAHPATAGNREAQSREFFQATDCFTFGKEFEEVLKATMQNTNLPRKQRVFAWIRYRSWASYSLYCVRDDRKPATVSDCARELKIHRQRVFEIIEFYEKDGALRPNTGKVIYPVVCPISEKSAAEANKQRISVGSQDKNSETTRFAEFLTWWTSARSQDNKELENARSAVKRIRAVQRADYKKWLALRTHLYKTSGDPEDTEITAGGGRSSVVGSERAAPAETPARPPASPSLMAGKVKTWLAANVDLPTAPDEEIVAKIAAELPDEAAFERFRRAAADRKANKWALFIHIARDAAVSRGRTQAAPAVTPDGRCAACRGLGRIERVVRGIGSAERCAACGGAGVIGEAAVR